MGGAGGDADSLKGLRTVSYTHQVLNEGPDHDLNEVMIMAYNDWHVDEWCAAYPGRFIPLSLIHI